jgi:hypothetical protein
MHLPEMPVPDVSTESGRRMLMVHMDGDGFISRSELPGNPLAGEVVRDRVVNKYQIPMTISVVEAEVSPKGLYPGLSATAEKVAQDIFRAPHVAIASHSYSHPFYWGKVNNDPNGGYNLRLPGYQFDLDREINGSIQYIEARLAPPGKKVAMFFWTGDCVPGAQALTKTNLAGVGNMNGGDTTATRSSPTMTEVEGLGMPRGANYQVFAPNQNENVYTNNWLGPFYGFERVIETFEFTESPRRLKPINIYFHTYITTKAAGMKSLPMLWHKKPHRCMWLNTPARCWTFSAWWLPAAPPAGGCAAPKTCAHFACQPAWVCLTCQKARPWQALQAAQAAFTPI